MAKTAFGPALWASGVLYPTRAEAMDAALLIQSWCGAGDTVADRQVPLNSEISN
jgi:hypothetical protein